MLDARMLLAIAEATIDDAEKVFLANIGVAERIAKGGNDFATTADLDIERMLRRTLTTMTGLPVYGEEGGGVLSDEAIWVVDPIDGTSNFAVGNPMCAILVSLLVESKPVLAVCSMPALGKRLSVCEGGPILLNGQPQSPLPEPDLSYSHIGFGSIVANHGHEFHTRLRRALLAELSDDHARLRVTGSVGVDLAFAALGVFSSVVTFSPFAWDNAVGVMLTETAGLTVTDLHGNPWTPQSTGVIAGTPVQHAHILGTINDIRA
ncbi:inositol monophosphatase family protein [Corynebacterium epidermidicanis]|uniref:Inositol monophosphatase/fructose-1,6-bisphosphatase family protein n=1 Tax=Corynebacterium epidermidicanis TaxID=1050174 RepID=A0A0G3GX67_9CORY|nr:inositol monophosphatase family protein [Corynebacterium epidermidicanis]AKK03467.1 inositol monophosphatase/fructose-1,6-bisphosphatase family protein [Corynebacterium epidermidicanis]